MNGFHVKHAAWQPHRTKVDMVFSSHGAGKKWRKDFAHSPFFDFALRDVDMKTSLEECPELQPCDSDDTDDDGP